MEQDRSATESVRLTGIHRKVLVVATHSPELPVCARAQPRETPNRRAASPRLSPSAVTSVMSRRAFDIEHTAGQPIPMY